MLKLISFTRKLMDRSRINPRKYHLMSIINFKTIIALRIKLLILTLRLDLSIKIAIRNLKEVRSKSLCIKEIKKERNKKKHRPRLQINP